RMLGSNRIDVEPRPPLETRDLVQPRNHFDMPMVMRQLDVVKGRSVNDVVVGRVVESQLELVEDLVQDMREVVHTRLGDILEMAGVGPGNDPGLKGKAAGVGTERGEMGRVQDDPLL